MPAAFIVDHEVLPSDCRKIGDIRNVRNLAYLRHAHASARKLSVRSPPQTDIPKTPSFMGIFVAQGLASASSAKGTSNGPETMRPLTFELLLFTCSTISVDSMK